MKEGMEGGGTVAIRGKRKGFFLKGGGRNKRLSVLQLGGGEGSKLVWPREERKKDRFRFLASREGVASGRIGGKEELYFWGGWRQNWRRGGGEPFC